MQDTLTEHLQTLAGIPDTNSRLIALVITTFLLAIFMTVLVFRARELDERMADKSEQ